MGEVIAFQRRARRAQNDAEPQIGGAKILFFLGVRYLRIEDPAIHSDELSPSHSDSPRRGKRRKGRARA